MFRRGKAIVRLRARLQSLATHQHIAKRCTSVYSWAQFDAPWSWVENPWTGFDPEEGLHRVIEYPRHMDEENEYIERRLLDMRDSDPAITPNVNDLMKVEDIPVHMRHFWYEEPRTR